MQKPGMDVGFGASFSSSTETGLSKAKDFIVRMQERSDKISTYYTELKKKTTPAMDRVGRSHYWTLFLCTSAEAASALLSELDTPRLLALILVLCALSVGFNLYSTFLGLRDLQGPVRDGIVMEDEFRSDMEVFKDSERARLGIDEVKELERLEYLPCFASLTRNGYLRILMNASYAVLIFAIASIPVFCQRS